MNRMNMITWIVFIAVCCQWADGATVGASYLNLRSDAQRRALRENAAQSKRFDDRDLLVQILANLNKRHFVKDHQWRIASNDFQDSTVLKKTKNTFTKLDSINDKQEEAEEQLNEQRNSQQNLKEQKYNKQTQPQRQQQKHQQEQQRQLKKQQQNTPQRAEEEEEEVQLFDAQESTKDLKNQNSEEKRALPNDSNYIRMIRRNLPYKRLQQNFDAGYL